jgi:threonine dehydratase
MITPTEESKSLSSILGKTVYLKREDLHFLRSHKGRSIPIMIDTKVAQGFHSFVISSSGNAALAAGLYISQNHPGTKLTILVGEKIPDEKLQPLLELVGEKITVSKVARPLMELTLLEKKGCVSLRQSTDDTALLGYFDLAREILNQTPDVSDVFIATSSGTTAVALHAQFCELGRDVKIHIVQTPACHPFIESPETGISIAGAIVDKVGHRREVVLKTITESKGSGIIATDEYIRKAQKVLESDGITTTANGALSIAGFLSYIENGNIITKKAVCIIGGK